MYLASTSIFPVSSNARPKRNLFSNPCDFGYLLSQYKIFSFLISVILLSPVLNNARPPDNLNSVLHSSKTNAFWRMTSAGATGRKRRRTRIWSLTFRHHWASSLGSGTQDGFYGKNDQDQKEFCHKTLNYFSDWNVFILDVRGP